MPSPPSSLAPAGQMTGLWAGLGAFFLWGSIVLYWKPLSDIPATEVVAHRIFWSLATVAPLIFFCGRWAEVRAALGSRPVMLRLMTSSSIIACNWGLYIWAVTHGRVVEASLGYFINPLVNVLLGRIFLGERLTNVQKVAVGLASLGVGWSVVGYGQFPWVALGLACTFGLYGLCRKTVNVESAPGLFLETLLLFPVALLWLGYLSSQGQASFFVVPLNTQLLLMGAGLVTTIPMLLFTYAARHMKLATLGLLQYLSPTITFLLGVLVFDEAVTEGAMVTFVCIWTALCIYTWGSVRQWRALS